MENDGMHLEICPNCGSTETMNDYPVPGIITCTKCGKEGVRIKLKNVEDSSHSLDKCPFCAKDEERDILFEDEWESAAAYCYIVVYKCTNCGKTEGYVIGGGLEIDDYSNDDVYGPLSAKIAQQEGKHISSASAYKKFQKALRKKEKSPIEKCKKQLSLLIHEKSQEMKAEGICHETIGWAKWQTQCFIESKGSLTNKRLKSLFAAALDLAQSSELISNGKTLAKKVSECQLERIFNTTRKTIRKWKRILQQLSHN